MAILESYVQRKSIATSTKNPIQRRRKFKKVKKKQDSSTVTETKSGSDNYADISTSDKYSFNISDARTIKSMPINTESIESQKNLFKILSNRQLKLNNFEDSFESITDKNLDVLKYITAPKRNLTVEPVQRDPFVFMSMSYPNRKGSVRVISSETLKSKKHDSRTSSRLSKKSKRSTGSRKSIKSNKSIKSKKSFGSKKSIASFTSRTSSLGGRRGLKLRNDEVENPIVPTYQLSNAKYVREGWTKLRQPNFKITEKLFTFQTSLSHRFMNAFQKRNGIHTSYYDNNQLAALFQEDGGSFVYYPNGEIAISITDGRIGPRLVVYSMTKTNINGVFMPSQPMAIFDKNGNGVVYGYDGEIRLNYDQAEGALYDTNSHQPIHWMWKINEYLKQRRADLDGVSPDPNDDISLSGQEKKNSRKKSRGKKSKSLKSRKSRKSRRSSKFRKSIRKKFLALSASKTAQLKKKTSSEDASSGEMLSVNDPKYRSIKHKIKKKLHKKSRKTKKSRRAKKTRKRKTKRRRKRKKTKKTITRGSSKKRRKTRKRKATKMSRRSLKSRHKLMYDDDDDDDDSSFRPTLRGTLARRRKRKRLSSLGKKHKISSHKTIKRTSSTLKSKKRLKHHHHKTRRGIRDLPPLRDPPLKPAPIVEIRPIALKITDHISLRIMDQNHIHVDFFYYPKHFRFHVGVTVHPELLVRIDKVIDPQPVTNIVPCYFELLYKRSSSLYNLHSIMVGIKKQAFKQRKMITLKKCRLMGYKYDIIRRRRPTKGSL